VPASRVVRNTTVIARRECGVVWCGESRVMVLVPGGGRADTV